MVASGADDGPRPRGGIGRDGSARPKGEPRLRERPEREPTAPEQEGPRLTSSGSGPAPPGLPPRGGSSVSLPALERAPTPAGSAVRALPGLSRGSPGALLGLSRGSPGALLGLSLRWRLPSGPAWKEKAESSRRGSPALPLPSPAPPAISAGPSRGSPERPSPSPGGSGLPGFCPQKVSIAPGLACRLGSPGRPPPPPGLPEGRARRPLRAPGPSPRPWAGDQMNDGRQRHPLCLGEPPRPRPCSFSWPTREGAPQVEAARTGRPLPPGRPRAAPHPEGASQGTRDQSQQPSFPRDAPERSRDLPAAGPGGVSLPPPERPSESFLSQDLEDQNEGLGLPPHPQP
ncbi:basic salivary proline-rich protein 3-like [Gracilinanus agilis]|uniref:basic salivary proline-rich protein 3-like n=1 Tax=Gracilinanus agilis TaxID=191870 RepID=UPI001CFDB65B|nr:basic salivary proline-rich protein 3-like [Gracilinanus agilis]